MYQKEVKNLPENVVSTLIYKCSLHLHWNKDSCVQKAEE